MIFQIIIIVPQFHLLFTRTQDHSPLTTRANTEKDSILDDPDAVLRSQSVILNRIEAVSAVGINVGESITKIPRPNPDKNLAARFSKLRNLIDISTQLAEQTSEDTKILDDSQNQEESILSTKLQFNFSSLPNVWPNSSNLTKISQESNTKYQFTHKMIVLVLSARHHFEARETIRDTWAKTYSDIYFMVGKNACPFPKEFLMDWLGCDLAPLYKTKVETSQLNQTERIIYDDFSREQNMIKQRLQEEYQNNDQRTSGKIILLDMIDTYNNLTLKTKSSFKWAFSQLEEQQDFVKSKQKYFMKIDDDVVLDVDLYAEYLGQKLELTYSNTKYKYSIAGWLQGNVVTRMYEKIPELLSRFKVFSSLETKKSNLCSNEGLRK